MKKIVILILLFIIYTILVCFFPQVTNFDTEIIICLQSKFRNIPSFIPVLMDCKVYSALIALPVIAGFIFFFRRYLLIDIILFCSSPLAAYLLNIFIKNIVRRPRPPLELQIVVQPSTFSFVSSHTLITTVLWGLVIFYTNKYCKNIILKIFTVIFSMLWILSVGLSRIWLGVHNPTDVFGGYFLGIILVYTYIKLINMIGGKC